MLSINTNLSSLIAQNSLTTSTNKLNQAIERMTTGFKINHASDNAANYSIATNMTTKIGAYDIAADNVAMGMDLVATASDIISTMQAHANRLQALSIQARNGTYGQQSMDAINAEAAAIMAEINRLYSTAEYNKVSLFNNKAYEIAEHLPRAGDTGFINDVTISVRDDGFIEDPKTYTDAEVAAMTPLTDAVTTVSSGQSYSISNVDELVNLAELVNSGVDTTGVEFVLGADIDMSSISNWTAIGSNSSGTAFKGGLNGNGHKIKNLTGSEPLIFDGRACTISNLGLTNVNMYGMEVGAPLLHVSQSGGTQVYNCYSTGKIINAKYAGGLINVLYNGANIVSSCYSAVDITTSEQAGGLIRGVSSSHSTVIQNCFATGNISQNGDVSEYSDDTSGVGGLIGSVRGSSVSVTNCYATGDVNSNRYHSGGLIGYFDSRAVTNCYATGDVSGINKVGGLIGRSLGPVDDCYAKGSVKGLTNIGGLIGYAYCDIQKSFSLGNVDGLVSVGGLVGYAEGVRAANCYSEATVSAESQVGGIFGYATGLLELSGVYSYANVSGDDFVGGLLGLVYCVGGSDARIASSSSYSKVNGSDINSTGGLVGGICDWEDLSSTGANVIDITNDCYTISSDLANIGGSYSKHYILDPDDDPDSSSFDESACDYEYILYQIGDDAYGFDIGKIILPSISTVLQVGINANKSNQIEFDTNFDFDISKIKSDISSDKALEQITTFINLLSEKSTQLGAVQNRLDSALESIEVNLENLTSSLSTIRDADIAEVSSEYIRQQILQQASATLMATANQSPAIALQLI